MQFEIKREDLLKLKQTNYDLYQLIMSQKSLDGDYCDWLDKEKLAKECELGYFKIEDLFTKKQITEAYQNNQKRTIEQEIKMIDSAIISGSQKKHAMLFKMIEETNKDIFIEIENAEQYHEIQDYCFGHCIYWVSSGKEYLPFDETTAFKDIKIGFRDIEKLQRCIFSDFASSAGVLIYDLKTEQFIN